MKFVLDHKNDAGIVFIGVTGGLIGAALQKFGDPGAIVCVVVAVCISCWVFLVVAPPVVASFISRVLRIVLADEVLFKEAGNALVEASSASKADENIAGRLLSQQMQLRLQDALIGLFLKTEFKQASVGWMSHLVKHQDFKDAITAGVREALKDEQFMADIKAVFIDSLQDEELQGAILRNAISIVKSGIRESMEDSELKHLVTEAFVDAVSDPKLTAVMRSLLQEALADENLHRASIQGITGALNPFAAPKRHSQ